MKTELKFSPHLEWWIEISNMEGNEDSLIAGDEVWTVGIVPGTVLEEVLRNLFRTDDDNILSQKSRIN